MAKIDEFLTTFVNGDYFLVFLALVIIILVVLVVALIKTRSDYIELLDDKEKEEDVHLLKENDMFQELLAVKEEEKINENEPLKEQVELNNIDLLDDVIDKYEFSEEENAIISAEELSKKTQERIDELGSTLNQSVIQKYEEDQENKAIISYEQLLKNASKISLTYKEEETDENAPKVNKVEIHEKEVSAPDVYLQEEEFLKILKEFRLNL